MDATRRAFLIGAGLLLGGLRPALADDATTLRLGVMPVYGGRTLMKRYEPFRHHLSHLLRQPVRIETAPDFQRYLDSLLAHEFEFAVAAAHFARIAQQDAGWQPLAQFEPDHDTLLLVRAGDVPKQISDLAGKEIAVIDRLAITVMAGLHHLEDQGLKVDKDVRVTEYRNHTSAVNALLSGRCAMAVSTSHGINQLPADMHARLALYRRLGNIPAFVVMASPHAPKAMSDTLLADLARFPSDIDGQQFMSLNGYTGLHSVDENAMRRADVYLKETRRLLAK